MRTMATLGLVALAIASTGCQGSYSRCRIEANYSSLLWSCCLKVTAENLPATIDRCVAGSGGRQE